MAQDDSERCLFCDHRNADIDQLTEHMLDEHAAEIITPDGQRRMREAGYQVDLRPVGGYDD